MPNEDTNSGDGAKDNNVISSTPEMAAKSKRSGKMVRRKPYLIAVVVLAVLAVGGAGFGVAGMVMNGQTKARLADIEAEKDAEETEVSVVEEVTEEGEKVVVERRGITAKDLLIRGDKLINNPYDEQMNYNIFDGLDGVVSTSVYAYETGTPTDETCYYNGNGLRTQNTYEVHVGVAWDKVENAFGIKTNKTQYEDFTIKNIDASRVVDVKVGEFGQMALTATILFLMDDGTVEYIPVVEALRSGGDMRSYGKLNGVDGVIRLAKVDVHACTGGRTTIAQKANGEFYDLVKIVEAQSDWSY